MKQYIKPIITNIKVEVTSPIVAGSPQLNDGEGGNTQYSKRQDFLDDNNNYENEPWEE